MLAFSFMRRALIVGAMLSVMLPSIGVTMVNRKTSMVGDALSHTALMGVGSGLILGFDPLYGMIAVCVIAGFAIEWIRHRYPDYGDMATAIILSLGLGLASIMSDFAPGGSSFDAYLFGSISSITQTDMWLVAIFGLFVVFLSVKEYNGLLALSISHETARLSGVPVKYLNAAFTLLTALTIAVSVKLVGALMVTSLLVLPVATSLIVARSYRGTYLLTVVLGIVYMMLGIITSYLVDLKPGGAIVINAIIGMALCGGYQWLRRRLSASK